MADYRTVAEVYQMQRLLMGRFGGLHGVRDKNAVEAAVLRPQLGYYNSIEEEAAALMELLGDNHGFLDGKKRTAFTATDVFLRRNESLHRSRCTRRARVHRRVDGSEGISLPSNPRLDPSAHQAAAQGNPQHLPAFADPIGPSGTTNMAIQNLSKKNT